MPNEDRAAGSGHDVVGHNDLHIDRERAEKGEYLLVRAGAGDGNASVAQHGFADAELRLVIPR
jgi:hypothetical protein